MKYTAMWALPLLVAQVSASAVHNLGRSELVSDAAPAPAPASAMKDALTFNFAISNLNYYDLSKTTCPKKVVSSGAASTGSASAHDTHDTENDEDEDGNVVTDAFDHVAKETGKVEDAVTSSIENGVVVKFPPPPWMKKKRSALLEANACVLTRRSLKAKKARSKHCETVMDVLRNTIHEVVTDIITCMSVKEDAPPAVQHFELDLGTLNLAKKRTAPRKVFLQSVVGPAPAPAVAAMVSHSSDVDVMVSFMPGEAVGDGASINVQVGIINLAGPHLGEVWDLLQHAIDDGALEKEIEQALQLVTGIAPKLSGFILRQTQIAPFDMAKCEGHVKKIVNQFAKTYTKERVPMALYNECTNFVTKISFSSDRVLDPRDTLACRETTASFAKHWKFGEKAEDYDFEHMCRRACQVKFGEKASMCKGTAAGPGPAPAPMPAV